MKRIKLTRNQYTVIDDADYAELMKHKWYAQATGYGYTAVRDIRDGGKRRRIYMHRQIKETPDGMETDHANHNTLDNRKANLRICSHAENQHNTRSQKGSSRYKGVGFHKAVKKWQASIRFNSRLRHLGYFTSETEAAKAYDAKAIELFGDFACMNF